MTCIVHTTLLKKNIETKSRKTSSEVTIIFIPKHDRYLELNGTASDVYELVNGSRTVMQIIDEMSNMYQQTKKDIEKEVFKCLTNLLDSDAIKLED